jgi:hypothetical protein
MMRTAIAVAYAVAMLAAPARREFDVSDQNDPRIAAVLEPIRARHRFPALGGAIVTSTATPDDLWTNQGGTDARQGTDEAASALIQLHESAPR